MALTELFNRATEQNRKREIKEQQDLDLEIIKTQLEVILAKSGVEKPNVLRGDDICGVRIVKAVDFTGEWKGEDVGVRIYKKIAADIKKPIFVEIEMGEMMTRYKMTNNPESSVATLYDHGGIDGMHLGRKDSVFCLGLGEVVNAIKSNQLVKVE